jgi:hypothetical protein
MLPGSPCPPLTARCPYAPQSLLQAPVFLLSMDDSRAFSALSGHEATAVLLFSPATERRGFPLPLPFCHCGSPATTAASRDAADFSPWLPPLPQLKAWLLLLPPLPRQQFLLLPLLPPLLPQERFSPATIATTATSRAAPPATTATAATTSRAVFSCYHRYHRYLKSSFSHYHCYFKSYCSLASVTTGTVATVLSVDVTCTTRDPSPCDHLS